MAFPVAALNNQRHRRRYRYVASVPYSGETAHPTLSHCAVCCDTAHLCDVPGGLLQRRFHRQAATSAERCSACGQRYGRQFDSGFRVRLHAGSTQRLFQSKVLVYKVARKREATSCDCSHL